MFAAQIVNPATLSVFQSASATTMTDDII